MMTLDYSLIMMRPTSSRYIAILPFLAFFVLLATYCEDQDDHLRGDFVPHRQLDAVDRDLLQLNRLGNHLGPKSTASPREQATHNTKVSYVTSFWAKKNGEEENPHRREVEAALLVNIYNLHFDQVVVFLDTTDDSESCIDFHLRMLDLSQEFLGIPKDFAYELLANKVQCVDVQTGQPTYYQMFQNALSDVVTGDVVVMSNGDIAFDDTISLARHVNPEVLTVLGTSGFSNAMPRNVRQVYESLMGTDYVTNEELQKDIDRGRVIEHPGIWEVDRCAETRFSWDTWIFHKIKLQDRLKEEDFQRTAMEKGKMFFYMNENGAENAALWAVEQAYPFSSTYQGCDRIQSWHFHLTPKTHKVRETVWRREPVGRKDPRFTPRGSVPKPWGGFEEVLQGQSLAYASKVPDCVQTYSCFVQ